jgi:hypothetical protein
LYRDPSAIANPRVKRAETNLPLSVVSNLAFPRHQRLIFGGVDDYPKRRQAGWLNVYRPFFDFAVDDMASNRMIPEYFHNLLGVSRVDSFIQKN